MLLKHKYPNILSLFFITAFFAFPYFSQAWSLPDWIWNKNNQEESQQNEAETRSFQPVTPPSSPGIYIVANPSSEDGGDSGISLSSEDGGDSGISLPSEDSRNNGISLLGYSSSGGSGGGGFSGSSGPGAFPKLIKNKKCQPGNYKSISAAAQALGKNEGGIACNTETMSGPGDRRAGETSETFDGSETYWTINCEVSCDPEAEGFEPPGTEKRDPGHCEWPDNDNNRLCSFYKSQNESCSVSCVPTEWDTHTFSTSEETITHRGPKVVCFYIENDRHEAKCKYKTKSKKENCTIACWPKNTGRIVPKSEPAGKIYVPATQPASGSSGGGGLPPASQGLK